MTVKDDICDYDRDISGEFDAEESVEKPDSPREILPGHFDLRKMLGRAPTVQEYRDARGW